MIDNFEFKDKYNVYDLVNIVRCLRAEGGCPWDIEQTHESIKKNLIEETYETIEAINKKSVPMLREELGDVLMQVIFHSQIEAENGNFDIDDVADENANIIYGQIVDEELGDTIRITVIATGFKATSSQPAIDFGRRDNAFGSSVASSQKASSSQRPLYPSEPRFADEDYIPDFLKRQ